MVPTQRPLMLPTIKLTLVLAVPPLPSVTVKVPLPFPPGLAKMIGDGVADDAVLPRTLPEYVTVSPSGSDAIAANENAVKSAIPNVGQTVADEITGARFAAAGGGGDGLVGVHPPPPHETMPS